MRAVFAETVTYSCDCGVPMYEYKTTACTVASYIYIKSSWLRNEKYSHSKYK